MLHNNWYGTKTQKNHNNLLIYSILLSHTLYDIRYFINNYELHWYAKARDSCSHSTGVNLLASYLHAG